MAKTFQYNNTTLKAISTNGSGQVQTTINTSIQSYFAPSILYSVKLQLILRFVIIRHVHSFTLLRDHTARISRIGYDKLLSSNQCHYRRCTAVWTRLKKLNETILHTQLYNCITKVNF